MLIPPASLGVRLARTARRDRCVTLLHEINQGETPSAASGLNRVRMALTRCSRTVESNLLCCDPLKGFLLTANLPLIWHLLGDSISAPYPSRGLLLRFLNPHSFLLACRASVVPRLGSP